MENDGRLELYKALSEIQDSLIDGYSSNTAVPEFVPIKTSGQIENTQEKIIPHIPQNDSLHSIGSDIAHCLSCRLAANRTKTVPGQGVVKPLVLVIGEAPGEEEDKSGLPFVGPAGQLLDKMLGAINLSRQTNCHICNIVKCRPPQNRDPSPDECDSCKIFLERQIAILQPKAFLAVGRISSQYLTGRKEGISKLRGRVYTFANKPLVVTYHPSALLRNEDLKRPAWEDLKILRSILSELK